MTSQDDFRSLILLLKWENVMNDSDLGPEDIKTWQQAGYDEEPLFELQLTFSPKGVVVAQLFNPEGHRVGDPELGGFTSCEELVKEWKLQRYEKKIKHIWNWKPKKGQL